MLWTAYLILIVALVAALVGANGTAFRSLRPVTQQVVRGVTFVMAMLILVASVAYVVDLSGESAHGFSDDPVPYLVFGSLGLGGLTYVAGTALWSGQVAHLMRAAGWVLIVIPMTYPSTLTLALALGAPLVLTVTRVSSSEDSAAARSKGSVTA